MKKQLAEIFVKQTQTHSQAEQENTEKTMIRFSIEKSYFAIPIECVVEIAFPTKIIPYPEKFMGHAGVVNLRGNIIPVLCIGGTNCGVNLAGERLIVVEDEKNEKFCFRISFPKKITVSDSLLQGDCKIFDIDGVPTSILSKNDFFDFCSTKNRKAS